MAAAVASFGGEELEDKLEAGFCAPAGMHTPSTTPTRTKFRSQSDKPFPCFTKSPHHIKEVPQAISFARSSNPPTNARKIPPILLRLQMLRACQRRHPYFSLTPGVRTGGGDQRQADAKHRSRRRGALHNHIASVVLDDFLHHRKPQPRSIFFAITDERIEQLAANRLRNAPPIVGKAYFYSAGHFAQLYFHRSTVARNRLTGIQQQIVEGAFQFPGVKPSFTITLLNDRHLHRPVVRMRPHRSHDAVNRIFYTSVSWPQ